MSEDQNKQEKNAKSARDAVTKARNKILEGKRKAYEAEVTKKVEAVNAAETILKAKQVELEDFIAENEDLYE